jgi:hypothetical protein
LILSITIIRCVCWKITSPFFLASLREDRTGRIGYCSGEQDWIQGLHHNKLPSSGEELSCLVLPQSLQQSDCHGFFQC